jgi:hypothetical protein
MKVMFVFCGGMFRSGSTLQYQVVSRLVEDSGHGQRVSWHSPSDFRRLRNQGPYHDSIHVFKAHKLTDEMRDEIVNNGALSLTVHRDIRDVVVSAMRKNNWTFRRIWRRDRLRYWTMRFDDWSKLPNVFICRYDELTGDLPASIRRIGDYLGIKAGDKEVAMMAKEYNLDSQKKLVNEVAELFKGGGLSTKYDPRSLLHYNHIASGRTGEYRSMLKPAQIRAIEYECRNWMHRWGYRPECPQMSLSQRLLRMTYGPRLFGLKH